MVVTEIALNLWKDGNHERKIMKFDDLWIGELFIIPISACETFAALEKKSLSTAYVLIRDGNNLIRSGETWSIGKAQIVFRLLKQAKKLREAAK